MFDLINSLNSDLIFYILFSFIKVVKPLRLKNASVTVLFPVDFVAVFSTDQIFLNLLQTKQRRHVLI